MQETYRKISDTRHDLERVLLLKYNAGIYRALLVAQKCFRADLRFLVDAENVWERRPNDCQVMRCNDKQGRR